MKTESRDNQTFWYDEQLLAEPIEQVFDIDYWQQRDRVIGSATGRGTTWFVQADMLDAALRHYRRGGLFGKLVSDSYWFTGQEQTRSYQEFVLLSKLRAAGVNVPKPIAARVVRNGLTYRADLLSEKVANAQDLVGILQQNALSEEMYRKIGAEIQKMHNVGVNHTDLNIHNILIDAEEKIWIIDFDKCYVQPGEQWKQSNIGRLKRSFEKEQKKRGINWDGSAFELIESEYKTNKC
ncbi:3-deoxy-D-manno-octulosonic acid kinase [uncultured Vibrio sp.]|uniref:3-deoxy-D-manno-octulosonic acid kinase n=1 Tax=uncultured Vibrio sp. TaxID=114054 RepID=UPI0025E27487|nr:3-deoxy-D-manno-octulosonic acid kinase [uncultured Vibrio sp.]